MSEAYTYRPATMADLEATTALMCATEETLHQSVTFNDELESLRSDWEHSETNLEKDTLLAFDGDTLVGYEIVFETLMEHAYCDGYVHPGYLDQGIGSHMLQWAEQRIHEVQPAEGGAAYIRANINSIDRPGAALLVGHGFELTRHFWQMRTTMDVPPAQPVWPQGITLRPFDRERDGRAVHMAVEDAFADHWGHAPMSFESWADLLLNTDLFDPSLWVVAMDDEQIAGVVLCRQREDMGWVRNLSVLRPWRRRGLGMALLLHAFNVFYERGERTVGLGVDAASLTGATRLYERAGMQIARRFETYLKPLART